MPEIEQNHKQKNKSTMKKTLTLLTSAMFIIAVFTSCRNDNNETINGNDNTPTISVTSVALTPTSATLVVDSIFPLTVTVLPTDATNQIVTWSSSNSDVVTVVNGILRATAVGVANITATTEDGNRTAYTSVAVVETQRGCNFDTPNWGKSLGTVTWGSTSNTNINSGTTTITGTDGRPNQIWSGAVFASACADKTTFSGGEYPNFNADCHRALTELTGHIFSWCAVVRFADQLCPYPFRVPTREDFRDLDLNLGGTGNIRLRNDTPTLYEQLQWFVGAEGTARNPQIGGAWGGARFAPPIVIAEYSDFWYAQSTYWSSTPSSYSSIAFYLLLSSRHAIIDPQRGVGTGLFRNLRCVR